MPELLSLNEGLGDEYEIWENKSGNGELLGDEKYYCPYCYEDLEDAYILDYCEKCGEYIGVPADEYNGFNGSQISNGDYRTNESNQQNKSNDSGKEFNQICCCILLILLIISTYIALSPSTL